MKVSALIGAVLMMAHSLAGSAAVLVNYDNPAIDLGYDSGIPHPALYADSELTASSINSHGVDGVSHMEAYQTNGWASGSLPDLSQYISFSLAPLAGKQLQFESLDINIWQSVIGSDGVKQFSLRSSQDGFSTDIANVAIDRVAFNPGNSVYNVSLHALSAATAATEFRLYFYDIDSVGQNYALISMGNQGDGITVNGNVLPAVSTVPNPGSSTLFTAGLIMLMALQFRRKS